MKLYRYESSKNTGRWRTIPSEADKEYEEVKDYLMADEPDEDDWVRLRSIEIPDDLIDELEDEPGLIKQTCLIRDPERIDDNPRDEGYDFDYWAAWSDDIKEG